MTKYSILILFATQKIFSATSFFSSSSSSYLAFLLVEKMASMNAITAKFSSFQDMSKAKLASGSSCNFSFYLYHFLVLYVYVVLDINFEFLITFGAKRGHVSSSIFSALYLLKGFFNKVCKFCPIISLVQECIFVGFLRGFL